MDSIQASNPLNDIENIGEFQSNILLVKLNGPKPDKPNVYESKEDANKEAGVFCTAELIDGANHLIPISKRKKEIENEEMKHMNRYIDWYQEISDAGEPSTRCQSYPLI